jgi:hypothetical protein
VKRGPGGPSTNDSVLVPHRKPSLPGSSRPIIGIQDAMGLSNFLNLQGENNDLHEGEISWDPLQDIIAGHLSQDDTVIDPDLEDEVVGESGPEISPKEARKGLQTVLQSHLRQVDADIGETRIQQCLERSFQMKALPGLQGSLDNWLIS